MIAPATRESLRLLTVLLSTAVIFAGFVFARALLSQTQTDERAETFQVVIRDLGALGVALFLTMNPFLIFMSNRGLRFELWILLILLFLMCLRGWEKRSTLGSALLGVIAGASHLLRITTPYYTMPLILIFGFWRKVRWHQIVLALALSVLLLVPHLIFNYYHSDSHDPFYTSNVHARYYRNKEFAGKPGFPALEEVRKNAWAGAPISTVHYVFGLHGFGEVVHQSLRGFIRIFVTAYPRDELFGKSLFLYCAYLLGLVLLPFTRHRWLIIALVLMELPAYFLAGKSFDPRLVLQIAPLQAFIMVLGFMAVARALVLLLKVVRAYRRGAGG